MPFLADIERCTKFLEYVLTGIIGLSWNKTWWWWSVINQCGKFILTKTHVIKAPLLAGDKKPRQANPVSEKQKQK